MSESVGDKELYCLIGDPVSHSLSPFIMNRAFQRAGVEALYVPMPVAQEKLAGAIAAVRAKPIRGVNVTYPHKAAVLPLVDSTSTAVDVIGAANTLHLVDERLGAHNTDAIGTVRALESIGGVDVAGQRAFIFGAGGAGRAAAFGLMEAGAAQVSFGVRNAERTEPSLAALRAYFEGKVMGVVESGDTEATAEAIERADIIVNATPLGMGGTGSTPLADESWIGTPHCCFDFVYHPRTTPFLEAAERQGANTIEGLALLVAQAQASFEIWTGNDFSLTDMFEAVLTELTQKESEAD